MPISTGYAFGSVWQDIARYTYALFYKDLEEIAEELEKTLGMPNGRCTESVYVSHAFRTWVLRTAQGC